MYCYFLWFTVYNKERVQKSGVAFGSAVVGPVCVNLHHECEVPCPNDFTDKQLGVLKLMMEYSAPPILHKRCSVIGANRR